MHGELASLWRRRRYPLKVKRLPVLFILRPCLPQAGSNSLADRPPDGWPMRAQQSDPYRAVPSEGACARPFPRPQAGAPPLAPCREALFSPHRRALPRAARAGRSSDNAPLESPRRFRAPRGQGIVLRGGGAVGSALRCAARAGHRAPRFLRPQDGASANSCEFEAIFGKKVTAFRPFSPPIALIFKEIPIF